VSIEQLSSRDVADVAALHGESLTGLLARLGPRARRAYYAACATSPFATGFVARSSEGLEGFVLGSANPAELRREVIGRDPLRFLAGIAAGVLRRPSNLRWLMKISRGPDSGHYDAKVPELIYLAVSPLRRGSGIGRQLVAAFTDAMRTQGHSRFELSVDADNREATRFYKRLGFERVGEYDEFGTRHVRYAMTLGKALR
jgi:ribosomal protein S18 acetylase RimI-like enzyme